MATSKFAYCHPEGDQMWCMYPNGVWAPPFPIDKDDKKTKASTEETLADQKEEKPGKA